MPDNAPYHKLPSNSPPATILRTLLGFDFGLQRIGVAVGQEVTGTASALGTVRARNGKPDWEMIAVYIKTWQPDALLVGLPLHADGSESEFTHTVKRFVRQLEDRFRLPVYTMDERLSSHAARQLEGRRQHELEVKGIDAVAACIILQNWLESK